MVEADHTKYLRIALLLVGQIFIIGIVTPTGALSAQQTVKHLNPVIEKLAAGKPFIGFQTGDLSLENARTLARTDIDYVYLEMEHGPMDFEGMHRFTVGMIDKAAILKNLWPLNPDGDLLAIMMIETAEGLKNADAIASVPGVGAIFVGAGGDLHQYLGVESNSPEVEQAFQTILKACLAHNVACGITALNGREIARRLGEGWKMIRTNDAALVQWRASSAAR